MIVSRSVVEVSETDTEYLLSIHASQKDRAKGIPGYHWDSQRVCWVYPRTPRNYDALIAEFGDDIVGVLKISRPGKASPEPPIARQEEEQAIQEKMRKIIEDALSGAATKGESSQLQALEAALAAKDSERAEVRRRADHLEQQLRESIAVKLELSAEVERLRSTNTLLQAELGRKGVPGGDPGLTLERMIRETAKEASGGDPKFCTLADRVDFNESLSIDLVKELGRELRRVVNCQDRATNLHDLLGQARDAKLLTERGIDLAHVIRKQRNVMAHENVDRRTHKAQVFLCFFAAALLWPEFSE